MTCKIFPVTDVWGVFILSCFLLSACKSETSRRDDTNNSLQESKVERVSFSYSDVAGIGPDSMYNRRDPSDIIKFDGKYYIWYTRMDKPVTSGYWGTIWYATSEDKGYTWIEQGMALGRGDEGRFDSHSVFTPNILAYKDKYYLYYTGVQPTPGNIEKEFENNSTNDYTAIGVAVADSPDGPFKRMDNNPIISHGEVSSDFDSYRVDDASLLVWDGKIWLYYKGRCIEHGKEGPKRTEMGVAIGDNPQGPFIKKGSILDRGHEVLVWKEGSGVSCLASISQTINHAPDGLQFTMQYESLENIPRAPGLYRPHLENGNPSTEISGWGISMEQHKGEALLLRFEMHNE